MRRPMRAWLAKSFLTVAAVAAAFALALVPGVTEAQQAKAYKAPRMKSGKPNLNGIYQANNAANWNIEPHGAGMPVEPKLGAMFAIPPGLGVVDGGEIPYTAEAKAKRGLFP